MTRKLIGPTLHGPCGVCQTNRSFGGYQAPTRSIEQNQTQLRLKLCNMPADGGLAGS
jgi:hypothetical protein